MKKSSQLLLQASLATALCIPSWGHAAGLIEQILANPRIQSLIGKPLDVTNLLNLCGNDAYKKANVQTCAEAANAQMVLRLPFEMRTVMANPTSAQSLRDICLAAQTTQQANSYLCAELVKADSTFAAAIANARVNTSGGNLPDRSDR